MTDTQENKLSMYLTTEKVVDANNPIWAGMPAFVAAKDAFSDKIMEIGKERQRQEKATTGVTKDKAAAEEAAISKAVSVASATYAYASVVGNNGLKDEVNYSPSELRKSRDTILIDRLRVILNAANTHAADLVDYGIAAADLAELDALVIAFEDQVQNPRAAISERATATGALQALFDETDIILKEQLDKLMEVYRNTSFQFYSQYKKARLIIDLGKGGSADSGDDDTMAPSEE